MLLFHSINSILEQKVFRSSVLKASYFYQKSMLLLNKPLIFRKEMPKISLLGNRVTKSILKQSNMESLKNKPHAQMMQSMQLTFLIEAHEYILALNMRRTCLLENTLFSKISPF